MAPAHTGTISLAAAEAQQERIKAIMAETSCTFGEALNVYIEERRGLAVVHQPWLAPDWDAA